MRSCAHCNRSLGEREEGVLVEGMLVHALCEPNYRKELSDRIAKLSRRRLRLPSLDRESAECYE